MAPAADPSPVPDALPGWVDGREVASSWHVTSGQECMVCCGAKPEPALLCAACWGLLLPTHRRRLAACIAPGGIVAGEWRERFAEVLDLARKHLLVQYARLRDGLEPLGVRRKQRGRRRNG